MRYRLVTYVTHRTVMMKRARGVSAAWTAKELSLHQHEDPEICRAIGWVKDGKRPSKEDITRMGPLMGKLWSKFDQLTLVDGLLYRIFENENGNDRHLQIFLPRKLIKEVLELTHDIPSAGHLGSQRLKEVIKRRFYWSDWQSDVEMHCKNCQICAERNGPSRKRRGMMVLDQPGYPMERVAMDISGPLPKTPDGNRYILVVVDYFTKWPEAYAIPNQEARIIAQQLVDEWICRYGVMQRLHTDQGRNFESAVFKEIIDILGIKKTRTTPYHPQSDGLVERMNRTLKDILSKLVNERQDDWDRCLPQALLAYRSTVQTSTRFSPHFLMFGRETRIPVDLMTPEPPQAEVPLTTSEYAEKLRKRFERTYAKAKDTTYNVGDRVWLYVPFVKKRKNLKLSRPWRGPYTIVKKISDVVYRIEQNANKRNSVKNIETLYLYCIFAA